LNFSNCLHFFINFFFLFSFNRTTQLDHKLAPVNSPPSLSHCAFSTILGVYIYFSCYLYISFSLFFIAGVESLETAINYWEDALAAYQSGSSNVGALLTAEEAEFCRSLERVLQVQNND